MTSSRTYSKKARQKDLNKLLTSEILGEQLFKVAARLSADASQRRKWQLLAALESQTKDYFLQYLKQSQQHAKADVIAKLQASASGAALALLPWKMAMQLLEDGTRQFLQAFKRLQQHSSPEDLAFFTYVVEHELAIQRFAQLEQQGHTEQSLQPVLALMDSGMPLKSGFNQQ
ncbi:hypothetical protein BKE30_04715 [Alkanindiges hydrocarboniclasticus]|uniref:Uncharacterized protein n=1 Tax=Alkanindiges hydrocarboniclasticus TaxID=1907941 RepID=A0A1S8CX64_9GAMM|nr:hypothetical protein [Alkanindiges hydrocarboniclasticus]ONG41409.1 hypothetical protein BKE30_04715 [Alkanindiges hydrocarboniclasticus]